ncbi:hypothetical protein LCGC14_1087840, partial [marine sediment metagenome]
MESYEKLIDKYKGQDKSAFILGAGTSLYAAWSTFRFSEIFDHVVVAVNSGIVATNWEEGDPEDRYWISNDALCMRWTWWDKVKKSKATKIVRNSWLKHEDKIKDFLIFNPRPTSEDVVNPEDKSLCYCCSVSSAIDLMIQCGCSKIFILGLDHQMIQGKHHFWQFLSKDKQPRQLEPAQGPWEQQKKVFPIHLKSYKALREFAISRSTGIYNCSPLS